MYLDGLSCTDWEMHYDNAGDPYFYNRATRYVQIPPVYWGSGHASAIHVLCLFVLTFGCFVFHLFKCSMQCEPMGAPSWPVIDVPSHFFCYVLCHVLNACLMRENKKHKTS
jgi:hypothetical protein